MLRSPVRLLLLTVLAAVSLAVAGCGSDDSKQSSASAPAPGNGTDLAFATDMIPHHRGAVDMAEVAQERGSSEFVKSLADDIVRTQNQEITQLTAAKTRLVDAGVKATPLSSQMDMSMSGDAAKLRKASPFDREFVDMMIPHHQSAILMAREELAKGASSELKTLAKNIISAQEREIREMNDFRKKTYGSVSPAGGVPAADGSMEGMDMSGSGSGQSG